MKVTEDMITRAIEAMEVDVPHDLRTAIDNVLRRKYVRIALEAALADVPERSFSADAQRSLRAAEAKLEKVRAFAEWFGESSILLAILDEAP